MTPVCSGRVPAIIERMISAQELAIQVHQRLLDHYGQPVWRNPLPPLDELVSTILSQNTNDVNRDRAFDALTSRFPSWEAVRDAEEEAVIEAIRPAGLANQKGPRIQALLRGITGQRGSLDLSFLQEMTDQDVYEWLVAFNGVGPKTASIVMLFSLGIPAFPVDTHIYRVTGRLGLRPDKISAEASHQLLADLFPPDTYYAVHLNIILHGRKICKARKPACSDCVLNDLCSYYRDLPGVSS